MCTTTPCGRNHSRITHANGLRMTTFARRFALVLGVLAGLSAATPVFAELEVGDYTLVGVERVSRFEFEYTYTTTVTNTDTAEAKGVMAVVSGTAPHVTVVEGDVWFGDIGAGATVTSGDTFTVRHDRRQGFDGGLDWLVSTTKNFSNAEYGISFSYPDLSLPITVTAQQTSDGHIKFAFLMPFRVRGRCPSYPGIFSYSYALASSGVSRCLVCGER